MNNLSTVLFQLRQERDHLSQAITALEGLSSNGASRPIRRGMSAAGRRRIAAAQRARWAKARVDGNVVSIAKGKRSAKRKMSPAARKRIAAAQKKRWAAFRKKQKTA